MWCGRWNAGRRDGDDGAATIEYVGLLFLIAAIVLALASVSLPGKVTKGAASAVCQIFGGDDCGGGPSGGNAGHGSAARNGRPGTSPGDTGGANGGGTGGDHGGADTPPKRSWNDRYSGMDPASQAWHGLTDQLKGFVDGVGNAAEQAGEGLLGAAWDDVKGFAGIFTHPTNVLRGIGHMVTHPLDTLGQLVWDDGSRKAWHDGRYSKAIFRGVWNVGSWFIPGYDVAKGGSKLSKIGKIADEAGRLGELAKAAQRADKAAEEAERAAKAGDVARARKAAEEARREADDAAKEARKNGCRFLGLGLPPPVRAESHGRFGGLVLLPFSGDDACKNASEAAAARDRAVRAAERAQLEKDINDAVKSGRFEDADDLVDKADANAAAARDAANESPTRANKDAANEAQQFADRQRQKVIDSKIRESRDTAGKSPEKIKGDRLEADVAESVRPVVRNYNRKYGPNGSLGEIDVETNKAIVECASGTRMHKFRQIANLVTDRTLNPAGKPVIVVAPDWSARQVKEAEKAGAVVVKNTAELKQRLRQYGEDIP